MHSFVTSVQGAEEISRAKKSGPFQEGSPLTPWIQRRGGTPPSSISQKKTGGRGSTLSLLLRADSTPCHTTLHLPPPFLALGPGSDKLAKKPLSEGHLPVCIPVQKKARVRQTGQGATLREATSDKQGLGGEGEGGVDGRLFTNLNVYLL